MGNLLRPSRKKERCREYEREVKSGHKFFLLSFFLRAERSQLRLLIQGGAGARPRPRAAATPTCGMAGCPKTKRKTFVNQDVGRSESVRLGLIRLSLLSRSRISIRPPPSSLPSFLPSPHFSPPPLLNLLPFRLGLVRIPHGPRGVRSERIEGEGSRSRGKRETVSWCSKASGKVSEGEDGRRDGRTLE